MRALVVALVLIVLAAVVVAQDAPVATKPVRKPRSVLQACRKQLTSVCPDRKDTMKCLQDGADSITDETCKSWVLARKACLTAASASTKCAKKENPRSCLRSLAAEDLNEECTSSDFYKSVRMFGAFRRRGKGSSEPVKAV